MTVAPRWSYFTQINGRRTSNKTSKPVDELAVWNRIDPHPSLTAASLSSSPSYRKYNTIFYKRTKRTEHLLSYKEQRTGKVCTANVVPPTKGFVNIRNKWVTSLKPNTLAAGEIVPDVTWIQNGPTCASFSPSHQANKDLQLLKFHDAVDAFVFSLHLENVWSTWSYLSWLNWV